jgi:hypothetical protein
MEDLHQRVKALKARISKELDLKTKQVSKLKRQVLVRGGIREMYDMNETERKLRLDLKKRLVLWELPRCLLLLLKMQQVHDHRVVKQTQAKEDELAKALAKSMSLLRI